MDDDRIAGVLVGTAAGDALGAPFEFGPPQAPSVPVEMTGGGGWEPGEWTDDTAMAIAVAEVAADGLDLRDVAAQDRIVAHWAGWARDAKDVGIQTRQVLAATVGRPDPAAAAREASKELHVRTGRSGGNGSLMRTAPVALAHLDDPDALVETATAISTLTHFDPEAAEACVLWCLSIRHAVHTGELDVRTGLDALPTERAAVWHERIEHAEQATPAQFTNNGWVVEAFQAAWCAIATTPAGDGHLERALQCAVRGGNDADTVAAIAGGLLGAAHGASAVPSRWQDGLHGWPGLTTPDLVALAGRIVARPPSQEP